MISIDTSRWKPTLQKIFCELAIADQGYDRRIDALEAGFCLSCDIHNYVIEVNSVLCKACGYCKEVCILEVFQYSYAFNLSGYQRQCLW